MWRLALLLRRLYDPSTTARFSLFLSFPIAASNPSSIQQKPVRPKKKMRARIHQSISHRTAKWDVRGNKGRRSTRNQEAPKQRKEAKARAYLWLLEAGIRAGFKVAQVREHALFKLLHIAYGATCMRKRKHTSKDSNIPSPPDPTGIRIRDIDIVFIEDARRFINSLSSQR